MLKCPKCGNEFPDLTADTCFDEEECMGGHCEFGDWIRARCDAVARSGREQHEAGAVLICECGYSWEESKACASQS